MLVEDLRFIRLKEICDEVYNEELEHSVDEESRKSLYRKKFVKLLEMLCCIKDNYKDRHKYIVSLQDAPIIKILIKEASIETSYTAKWFYGNLKTFTTEEIVKFYEEIEIKFKELVDNKKTDIVHVNEWLSSIDTIIDYSTAKKVLEIKNLLEEFRICALPLTAHIDVGQVEYTNEKGNKTIILEGIDVTDNIVDNTKDFYCKKQYMSALYRTLSKYNEEVEKKSYELIKKLTQAKIAFDATGTAVDYLDKETKEIASIYVLRDYNIQKYLKENNKIKQRLEKELNIEDINAYYNMIQENTSK